MHQERFQVFIGEEKLIPHPYKAGFYKAKIAPGIYVSKQGKVWNDYSQKLLWVHIGKKNYPTVRIGGKNVYLHRILCETFLDQCGSEIKLHVNHRDGNKQNFDLKNLEWSTPSGNSNHAYETGLRNENRSVKLRDIVTGEVKEFISIGSCAKFLGKGPSSVFRGLQKKLLSPYLGRYDLVWKNHPWTGFTEKDFGKVRKGQPRSIVAINIKTKEITIFPSATKASESLGINRPDISTIATENKRKTVNGFSFIWTDEFNELN